MKIVATLVKQIGATLENTPGESGYGTCVTVTFDPSFAAGRSAHDI